MDRIVKEAKLKFLDDIQLENLNQLKNLQIMREHYMADK